MSKQEDNSKIIDFEEAKKVKEQTEENVATLKAQIEQDQFLKYAIRIISNTSIDNENLSEADLLEEYKSECLKEGKTFQSLGDPTDSQVQFYYQLFQLGYRSFGAEFFKQMCMNETNCVQMFIGIWALVNGLETLSDGLASIENQLRAYKNLKLTDEQKEELAKELQKTSQEYIEELMKQSEELEKLNEEKKED